MLYSSYKENDISLIMGVFRNKIPAGCPTAKVSEKIYITQWRDFPPTWTHSSVG